MSSNIPPEIIADILIRLPVKPLLRFRSVSKPWRALIDSPDFIKRHLNRSITTKSNRSLYLGGSGTLYSLDYSSLKSAVQVEVPFKESDEAHIVGSCNGLLLLQRKKDIALFNPASRKYRVLPDTPIEYPKCNVTSYFEKFGFGYDSVNDDYKVIRVCEIRGELYDWICSETKIYSLKNNCWRKVENFPYCLPYKRVWGVHLHGCLHTVVNTSSESSDPNSPEVLVAFSFVNGKCRRISLPDGLDKSYFDVTAEVFEGMLCVSATYSGNRTDFWLMRVYGVKETWFKLLSISPPLVKPYVTMYPLALSRNGREVLLNYDDKRLIWYNRERKSVRRAPFRGLSHSFYVEVCVDSLVSLDGPGGSVGVKKEIKVKSKEDKGQKLKEVQEEKQTEVKMEKMNEVKDESVKENKNKKRDGFLSVGFKLKL